MIKKVSFLDSSVNCVDYQGYTHNVANSSIINKINELVNAVNELQLSIKPILEERESGIKVYEESQDMYDNAILDALKDKQVDVVVEPADPYAEQRKWIGKACYFWDNNAQTKAFGWLEKIDQEENEAPFMTNFGQWYDNCEPVKPDDDIIYKGE